MAGTPIEGGHLRRSFRLALKKAGIEDFHFHDLRHTFVVRRIVQWQAQNVDIDEAMLSLSTYVGHAMVTNTYWYLSAVPELMALAAARFESFVSHAEVQDA